MKNKGLLIGVGVLALGFLMNQKSGCNGRKFTVPAQYSPDGKSKVVCESDLPRYGFILYQGAWYHSSQFPPPGAGSGTNWTNWAQLLQQGLNSGMAIYDAVNNVVQQFQQGSATNNNNTSSTSTDPGIVTDQWGDSTYTV